MPSVGTVIAQPKTRKLVNTQNYGHSDEQGPHFFLQSDIDSWYADYSDQVTKVSATVYIVKDANDFYSVAGDIPNQGNINNRRTYTDMGKTLYIGTPANPDLVVMQLVQIPGLTDNSGLSGAVGFMVVENNCLDTPSGDWGRLVPRVARV